MLARAFCSLRPIVRRTQLDGQPRQSLIQPPREPPSEINVGGVRTSPGVVSWPGLFEVSGPSLAFYGWVTLETKFRVVAEVSLRENFFRGGRCPGPAKSEPEPVLRALEAAASIGSPGG